MSWTLSLHENRSDEHDPLCFIRPDEPLVHALDGIIHEARTYWWLLAVDGVSAFRVRVSVNGMTLTRDIVSESQIWFAWPIGFHAGVAHVAVSIDSLRQQIFELVIDPDRNKLVRRDFRLMLGEIFTDTKSLATLSGFTTPIARGAAELPIAKIELILQSVPVLSRLVRELHTSHRTRLRRHPRTVALSRARDVKGTQLRKGLVSGTRRLDTEHPVGTELRHFLNATGGLLPVSVTITEIVRSNTIREHAEIAGFLRYLVSLLRKAARSLPMSRPEERLLADRVSKAARSIGSLLQVGIFNAVTPASGRWRHSHLYERTEPYRSIYKVYRDIIHGIEGIEGDHTRVSLQETHRLYETWVALRLARAAASLDSTVDASTLFIDSPTKNNLTFSLINKEIRFKGGLLLFKPVFDEVWRTESNRGSYTRQMIPDLALDFTNQELLSKQFIVLDSKYRVETQLNDAISSLHMYRDSIVEKNTCESIRPGFTQVVSGCYIITPEKPHSFDPSSDWQSKSMPSVIFYEGYQRKFRFGGIVLKPGMTTEHIAEMLLRVIDGEPASPSNATE